MVYFSLDAAYFIFGAHLLRTSLLENSPTFEQGIAWYQPNLYQNGKPRLYHKLPNTRKRSGTIWYTLVYICTKGSPKITF